MLIFFSLPFYSRFREVVSIVARAFAVVKALRKNFIDFTINFRDFPVSPHTTGQKHPTALPFVS
jgi:hypothetical protein